MLTALVVLVVWVWTVSALLTYQMEFVFWKQLKNLSYEKHIYKKDHFLRFRNMRIRFFRTFGIATIYRSGNAEIHRMVVTKALVSAILGPIGFVDASVACWRMSGQIPFKNTVAGFLGGFGEAIRSKYRNTK